MVSTTSNAGAPPGRVLAHLATECWLPLVAIGGYATAFALNVREMEARESGYPIALAVLLVALGLWHAIATLRTVKADTPDDAIADAARGWVHRWRKALIAATLTLGYFVALGPVEFYVATFAYLLVTSWALGTRRPLLVIGTATVFTGICYVIFTMLLDIRLP